MKLKLLKEIITRGGPFYPDVGVPDKADQKPDARQSFINDLLEFRARCAAKREQPITCGEVVKEIDALIRKNYGKFTDI